MEWSSRRFAPEVQREFYRLAAKSFSSCECETGALRRTHRVLLRVLLRALGVDMSYTARNSPWRPSGTRSAPKLDTWAQRRCFCSTAGWAHGLSGRKGGADLLSSSARDGWDECQKLPFGMSQEMGMGRFALIPAWTHAKEDFQNSQPVISCHEVKKNISYSLFFHSKACNQKLAGIIMRRFVCYVNMFLKSWIQMTKF